jgi:acyl transferase domain-containing protein
LCSLGRKQVVIAGHAAAVTRACEAAKAAGAKRALPLAVSASFHSSVLKPAGERLRIALEAIDLAAPMIPLVNNVDVAIQSQPAAIKDALVRQASSPVRWVEVIQKMRAEGIDTIIEFGPGKVLTGLIRRIEKEIKTYAVFDPASLQTTLEAIRAGELRIIAAILEVSPDTKGPEDRLCLAHAKASVPWQTSDREDTDALRTRGQSATPLACTGADGLLKTRCRLSWPIRADKMTERGPMLTGHGGGCAVGEPMIPNDGLSGI